MGPIVCATRGGEAGRRTQERAIALAKERGTELIFLCVFDPGFAGSLNSALSAAVIEEQQWLGRALVSVAQERAREQGVEAGAVVLSGPVLESIEDFLCEAGAATLYRPAQGRLSPGHVSPRHSPKLRQTCRAEHQRRSGRGHSGR